MKLVWIGLAFPNPYTSFLSVTLVGWGSTAFARSIGFLIVQIVSSKAFAEHPIWTADLPFRSRASWLVDHRGSSPVYIIAHLHTPVYTYAHSIIANTVVFDWKFTASFLRNTFVVLTIILIEFRNNWYLIWKPKHRAFKSGKKWGWYHPEDGQAHLTKKTPFSLKHVWSLSWKRFFQFQYCFQTAHYRVFFWGIKLSWF